MTKKKQPNYKAGESFFVYQKITKTELSFVLSSTLFWDTQISAIDPEKNVPYIMERIMTRGNYGGFQDS